MTLRILFTVCLISLTASLFGQLKLEWLIDVSGSYHYPIAARAFIRHENTIMFAYGEDVYHIPPHSQPVKTYTSPLWISRSWKDGNNLVTEESCKITERDFYSGQIKSEHCLNFFNQDPPTPFQFAGQSDSFYFAGKGKWIAKFNKSGTRLKLIEFPQGGSIMGISLGGDRIFASTYSAPGSRFLIYDTSLTLQKDIGAMEWYNLAADKSSNCYFLTRRPGYSVVWKTDSTLDQLWSTDIADTYLNHIFLKGDSLFVTGEMSDFAPTNTGPKSAYSILNPQTGVIIETAFFNFADDNQFDTEKIVEMESDGTNLYGSGVRTNEGHGIPFVFKLSENGTTAIPESEKLNLHIYSAADQIIINSSGTMIAKIIISDVLGRKVYESDVTNLDSSYRVGTIGWKSGIYFVNLVSDKSQCTKKLFIHGQEL